MNRGWKILLPCAILTLFIFVIFMQAETVNYFNPHGNYDVDSSGCALCHSGHYAKGTALLANEDKTELCYSCHDGSNSTTNIRDEFGDTGEGSSESVSYHPVPTGVLACTDCHNPHLTPDTDPGILSVGEEEIAAGIAVCGGCHNEESTLIGSDIVTAITGTPHGVMAGPQTGTDIKCIRCHEPHGSSLEYLLRQSIQDDFMVSREVTGNNNTVCFGCHATGKGNFFGENIYNQSRHGSTEPAEKAASVYPGMETLPGMCANCHEPHGRTGNPYYTRAEGNALCAGCHDQPPNPPAGYSYRGLPAYDNTPHATAEGPSGSKNLYRAFSQGFAVWEGDLGQTPHTPGQPVSLERTESLFEWNTAYLRTDLATVQDDYNTQMYRFRLETPVENVNSFRVKWVGYGEPTPGHPLELSIWNLTLNEGLGGWEPVSSGDLGTEGIREITLPDGADVADYISEDLDIYLLASAMHDGTPPQMHNVSTEYTAPSPPTNPHATIRVSWQTNEPAKAWLEYGTAEGSTTLADDLLFKESHSFEMTGLESATEYYYQVTLEDRLGNQQVFPKVYFELSDPPPAAVLVQIPHLWDDPPKDVAFTWYRVHMDDTVKQAKIQYKVELSTSPDFSTILKSSAWLNDSGHPSLYTQSHTMTLDFFARYYWRVKTRYIDYPLIQTPSALSDFMYSCPVLYTWNGEQFVFVTDIAAGSNLGIEIAAGRYLEPTPDEQVVIPDSMLVEKDGYYTLKIKNELNEIDYIDNLQLQAVDHPVGTRIALNDFVRRSESARIYTYSENIRPVRQATYIHNPVYSGGDPYDPKDITEKVSKIDNVHAMGTLGNDNQFIFDLGDLQDAAEIKLVVVGWTEFMNEVERADRVEKSRQGIKRADDLVEVLQPDGSWLAQEIAHIPGHTKTAVIDLTGMFAENTQDYIVRLRGLYRPRIDFVGVDTTPQASITVKDLTLAKATLSYGGVADRTLYPSPYYDYYNVRDMTVQHEGRFTRYGDVLPLLTEINDKLVVMDTGDELTVSFEALPAPAPGMTRSYVLKPYAYYKELSAARVEPMPFWAMDLSFYPDSLGEYPAELQAYVEEWNTRIHPEATEATEASQQNTGFFESVKAFFSRLLSLQNLFPAVTTAHALEAGQDTAVTVALPLHYSLNTNYIELEVESTRPFGGVGYCTNCHVVHGNNNDTKQLRYPVATTCFANDYGCHSDPQNSAGGFMSSANFTGEAGPTSRHSIDPEEQDALGTRVGCLNCHNPHLNDAESKTVDPFDTNVILSQWTDNGVGNYIGSDGSVYLLAKTEHDGIAPVISNIAHTLNHQQVSATVTWQTDEAATRELEYIVTPPGEGVPPDYSAEDVQTAGNSTTYSNSPHSLTLEGLEPGMDYHYRVKATDRLGNTAYSSEDFDRMFRLTAPPPVPGGLTQEVFYDVDLGYDEVDIAEFSWDAVTDPQGYTVQYFVQVTIGTSTYSSGWLANNTWEWILPKMTGTVTWKVKARNSFDAQSAYSEPASFPYPGVAMQQFHTGEGTMVATAEPSRLGTVALPIRLTGSINRAIRYLADFFTGSRPPGTDIAEAPLLQGSPVTLQRKEAAALRPQHYSLNTNYVYIGIATASQNILYHPDSPGANAWEKNAMPTFGSPGTQAGQADKTAASTPGEAAWSTSLVTEDRAANYQMFKFSIQEEPSSILKLSASWTGYGTPTPGYATSVYIYNFTTETWQELKNEHIPTPATAEFFANQDNSNYCNKCHDNNPPEGVLMGDTPPANTAVSVVIDYHGDKKGTRATLKPPYTRGSGRIACDDCHDPHGSSSINHLRETVNFQGGISVTDRTGAGVQDFCRSCHDGDFVNDWHGSCGDCHVEGWTDIDGDHATPALITEELLSSCFTCHGHSRDDYAVFPEIKADYGGSVDYCHACHTNWRGHNDLYPRAF